MKLLMAIVLVLVIATSAFALERKAYTMRHDYGSEPLYDCYLCYYYYILNTQGTGSSFWGYYGWDPGDVVGKFFTVGDLSMFSGLYCDPEACFALEQLEVLDFAGFGTIYPDYFNITFDVFCSDDVGCPVGPSLYNSGPVVTGFGWNVFTFDPPICLDDCVVYPGPPPSHPRILITAQCTGTEGLYPQWGFDNISTAATDPYGREMHDYSCLDALYPRPYTSHYPTIHSGYYGNGFPLPICPPEWVPDGRDTNDPATQWGYIELAWTIFLICQGPTATEPSTWGNIKSIYR